MRARNPVGQATVITDWHAIVPGLSPDGPAPGVACGIGLTGSLQFISHTGVMTIDGERHQTCLHLARDYANSVASSPGPREPDDPHFKFAAPGHGDD